MTPFACAVRTTDGAAPSPCSTGALAAGYGRACRRESHSGGGVRAIVWASDAPVGPGVARVGRLIGVGVARLDDRAEVAARLGVSTASMGDLELAVRLAAIHGEAGVRRLLGEFAFVVWDASTRRLLAVRDALGVRPLYWATPAPDVVAFASHAGLLAADDGDRRYDLRYLAGWMAAREPEAGRTAYAGVREVPGGSMVRLRGRGVPAVVRYWSPAEVQAAGTVRGSEAEQCDAFRALLVDAVRVGLSGGHGTWAHLSGGLDSSSVVSVAQWLAERGVEPHGLAGTVTYVDPLGTATDERAYSDAVVARYRVRNERIPHQVGWRRVWRAPPLLDQPSRRSYLVAARDRDTVRAVRRAGGRVLLTGMGGDHLLLGTMLFFADWVARGQLRRAGREMLHRAALGRVSFWRLAYESAVRPLLPLSRRGARWPGRGAGAVPRWMATRLVRRYDLHRRTGAEAAYGGRWGHKYADALGAGVAGIASQLPWGEIEDALDVRHPFLHRPLVEFALRLAPEMCVRPHARKWILREALRGILPDAVRTRVGKGSGSGLLLRALAHDRPWIDELLRDPILAQLGVVEPAELRAAIDRAGACAGTDPDEDPALLTVRAVEVEMWLRVRSGR